MPAKKKYKKRPNKKKNNKPKLGKPSRGLTQSVYFFKRKTTEVTALADTALENGWTVSSDNGVYKSWTFNLNQLVSKADFTNLFKMYKICAVKIEMCFNNTGSVITANNISGQNSVQPGCQLQVYTIPNRIGKSRGVLSPLTEQIILDTQSHKKRLALNGGRPLKFYFKLNQLGMVFHNSANSDYTLSKARFISTEETGTEHYGFEMYINRVDGQSLSTGMANEQAVRINTTYYLACKGVE